VGHLHRLAEQCQEMPELPASLGVLRVGELWAVGELLGASRDLEWATVAACVDLPVEEVPWLCRPDGADGWAQMTRASKNPVLIWWRSARAPVWNHRIVRPLRVWSLDGGVEEDALEAIMDGHGAEAGLPDPGKGEFAARMQDELRVSLGELQRRTREYENDHFTRLGIRGDALFAAADGYLDVLAALNPGSEGFDGA
jgi:hypothetical protein